MIVALRGFRSLRDMLKTNFIEQGRKVKEAAGKSSMSQLPSGLRPFQFPAAPNAYRTHARGFDCHTRRPEPAGGVGILIVDCHQFGLSPAEPLAKVRKVADEWKQPFQQEYTERSVNETFEKLLSLRSDVERALDRIAPKTTESVRHAHQKPCAATLCLTPPIVPSRKCRKLGSPRSSGLRILSRADLGAAHRCAPDPWPFHDHRQNRQRPHPHSSWEVTAFVSEDSPSAEDLRRAVVARALVTAATETAKETGNATGLDRALSIARIEVSRLHERVDVAKQAKDTEAAVNLGISTKRLLSALDEAEKL